MGRHELLEIDESSSPETIKRNYFRLAKEFHPDRYFAISDDSIKAKLTAVFDAVTDAYNLLKDEKQRRHYFKSAGAVKKTKAAGNDEAKASEMFKKGVEEFKKGDFRAAVEKLKSATELMPKNAGYWNYLSLAYSKIQGKLKEAENALLAAIKLEPSNADYFSNLGLIYMKSGAKKKAHNSFEQALKVDPKNEKAKKGLEKAKSMA